MCHKITRLILSYLRKNPDARDTIDGIQWWVLRECIDMKVGEIQSALDELVRLDVLIEGAKTPSVSSGDATPKHRGRHAIYSLNLGKLPEILRILAEQDERDDDS